MTEEEWRPVLGYEDIYQVSNQGHVRSADRLVKHDSRGGMRAERGIVLTVFLREGYPSVSLGNKIVYTHKLVCEAWRGPRPDGLQCRHLDGNPLNCTPQNLRWGTPKENVADTMLQGRHANLSKTHCVKGHEYSEANTYRLGGRRFCRSCNRAAGALYNARKAVL